MPLLDEIRDFLSTPTVPAPTYGSDYESYVDELSSQHPTVPSDVVKKLIEKESSWKPNATVYTGKEKYGMARGLGQFIDETAQRYIPEWKSPADSYDPQRNIQGIFNYLDDLVNREGSIDEALKTYHGRGTDILGTTSEDYSRDILADIPLTPGKGEPINLADIRTFLGEKKEAVKEPEKIVEAPAEKYLPEIEGAPAGTTEIVEPTIERLPVEAPATVLGKEEFEIGEKPLTDPLTKKGVPSRPPIPETPAGATALGVVESLPFVNIKGKDVEALKTHFGGSYVLGNVMGTVLQGFVGAPVAIKSLAIIKNPMLRNMVARSIVSGGLTGSKQEWTKNFKDSFWNTVQAAGAGAVSVAPEMIPGFAVGGIKIPWKLIQLIGQPASDLAYDASVDAMRGKDVGSKEWWGQEAVNLGLSTGFALQDISTGEQFRITQKDMRKNAKQAMAKLAEWTKGRKSIETIEYKGEKYEVTPGAEERIETIIKAQEEKLKGKEKAPTGKVIEEEGVGVEEGVPHKRPEPTEEELAKLPPPGKEAEPQLAERKVTPKELAETLTKIPTREEAQDKITDIIGIKEKRLSELDEGAKFASDEEKKLYNLAEKYSADLEHSIIEKDFNETEQIIKAIEAEKEKISAKRKGAAVSPTGKKAPVQPEIKPEPVATKVLQKKEPVTKEISKMSEKEIRKELRSLEHQEELVGRAFAESEEKGNYGIDYDEAAFATDLRTGEFSEKITKTGKKGKLKGKTYESLVLGKGLSKLDWDVLTGKTTGKRSAELNKKLDEIVGDWNTTKANLDDAVERGLGIDRAEEQIQRVLDQNDNWEKDAVARILQKAVSQADLSKMKRDIEITREAKGEEVNIAFEELSGKRAAIEGRIKELKKLSPDAELFKTPKSESFFESERGAIDFSTPSKTTSPTKNLMKGFKKFFTAPGLLPQKVFEAKVEKEGWYRAEMREVEDNLKDYEKAVHQAYKKELTDIERYKLDAALKGEYDVTKLPEEVRQPIKIMREHIDAMSQRLIDSGMAEGDLEGIIAANKGFYATRSYRVHDDPNWSKKVPEEVRNKAKALLRQDLETSNIDIQTKMDNLQGRKSDLVSLQRRPDKATVVEERLLRLKTETEDVVAKNNKVIDRKIAIIKNRMQVKRDRLQSQRQSLNKKKTEVWRERPVTEQTKKALEKREKIIEQNIEKIEEQNEVTDDIMSQMDELQGDLAKTIEDILKHPTRLQDLGAVMVSFNFRIENVTGLITKSKIAEGAEIIKQVTSIKKQAQQAISKINERKTKIWREVGEDVDIGAKSTEEKIKNIDTEIDELSKEITEVSEETINGLIGELLYKENAPVGIVSRGSKLGAKNLSILKKRKDIAPEIRALWGEYKQADVNYVRSVSKMANLVSNNDFLVKSLEAGKNDFFFDKPKGDYHVKMSAEGSKVLEPLDGKYTTPEIKEAFEKLVEVENNPAWLKWWMRAIAIPKYSKTVASPMTHIRNFTANTMFAVANAHLDIKKMSNAMAGLIKDSKAFRARRRRMLELGVIGESARAGELRAVLKEANLGGLDYIVGSKYKKTLKRVGRIPEKLYAAEDDVWKWYAFENEFARYKKVFPDKPAAELEKDVAKIIRNTYPTYSQVPLAIQKLRRFPILGTFVSFPWEVVRTGVNTIKLAKTELANPKTRAIGAQRLAGLTAATTLSGGLAMASRFLTGVSKKEEENMRHFAAPWDANQQLFHLGKRGTGVYQYVNVGYTDPYSYVKAPLIAFMRGENWQEKLAMSAGEAFEPFLSEDIFTQKILDLARNQKKSGGKVWNPQDTGEGIATDIIKHFMDALEPGAVSSGRRIYKGIIRKESAAGHPYNVKDEITALMSGFRINRMDISRALPYKVFEFKRNNIEAARLERKKTIEAGYSAKMKNYREMHEYAAKAVNLGLTPSDVKSILRNSGLSKPQANAIMTATYVQFLTDQYNKKIREKK